MVLLCHLSPDSPVCVQLDLAGRGAVACDAWAWCERLQRAIDGCHTTDDMNAASMAEYHGAALLCPHMFSVLCVLD